MIQNQKYLNLGCGNRFHDEWTNINFVKTGENVIPHNLLNGIPFPDNHFDLVYHSHVLEHFSKKEGVKFIIECYRVLKPGGVIRIAVPNLEQIVREYLLQLDKSLSGDQEAQKNYDWILLELYDQTIRNKKGGDMYEYLLQTEIPNEEYVYSRIGDEARRLRISKMARFNETSAVKIKKPKYSLNLAINKMKKLLISLFFFKEMEIYKENLYYSKIGKFRMSGEIHQWMYDRFSLERLLLDTSFVDVKIQSATTSYLQHWNSFELDSKGGVVHKPDSIFIEAKK